MKPTKENIAQLDKLLDSPADLQKLGAAMVHTMKQQLKPNVEITEIRMPIISSALARQGGAVEDSISVSVNDVVSVGWSADIGSAMKNKINEQIKAQPAAEAAAIKAAMPKGLEGGKRVLLAR
jgi:hypothetical protein